VTTFTASLTNLTGLQPQSMSAVSTYADEYWHLLPTWLQIHTDLRAHDFAHSADLWHQPRHVNVTCARTWRLCGINPAIHFCMERELVVVSLCPECCSNINRCQWHLQQHRLQFISWIVKLCVTELVFQESLQCTGKRERLAHVCFVYWLIYIWLVKSNVNEFL